MRGNRLGLTLIRGLGRADALRGRIALSLVHPRGRIDVPISAIRSIEAHAEQTFFIQQSRLHGPMSKSMSVPPSARGCGG